MKNINWGPSLFLIIYQVALVISWPFYFYYSPPGLGMVLISIILLYLTGLSITAGYHRLYSHKSYKTNKFVEFLVLFFGSMSAQGSALRWSFDHRLHHAYVDTDKDPYSIKKGFWYAHCLWILNKPEKIDPKVVPDLIRNPLVMFQDRYYRSCLVICNFLAFLFVGWLLNDYVGSFFIALWTRLFFLHHSTWFINSLAHTWGDKPFCQEQSAVNNFIIALLTFGEGYHNFHHTFANDYRNGIRWFHFDPTKWLIWTLSKMGLASGLKRVDALTIKKRLVLERSNLLSERLKELWYIKKEDLEKPIQELSDRLLLKIAQLNELKDRYYSLKKESYQRDLLKDIKNEMRQLRKSLKQDWAIWVQLSRNILNMKPLHI